MSFFSENQDQRCQRTPRGHSTVTFLIAMVVMLMFGFAGLEIGLIYRSANLASSVADATALAAANRIPAGLDTSLLVARDIAQKHTGPNGPLDLLPFDEPNSGGDLEFGYWDSENRTFELNLENVNAVRSTIHFNSDHPNGSIPLIFGDFFGFSYADLSRQAVAVMKPRPGSWALFLGSSTSDQASVIQGNSEILVPTSGVSVLSPAFDSFRITENGYLNCESIHLVGQINTSTESRIDGNIFLNQDPITRDDLNFYTPPYVVDEGNSRTVEVHSGTTSLEPGWYPDGISANVGTYLLSEGTYVFGGTGIVLQEDAQILGDDAIVVIEEGTITLEDSSRLVLEPAYRSHPGVMTNVLITTTSNVTISGDAYFESMNAIMAENASFDIQGGTLIAGQLATLSVVCTFDSEVVITGSISDSNEPEFYGSTLVD